MCHSLFARLCIAALLFGGFVHTGLGADNKDNKQKRLSTQTKKFQYPGGKPFADYNAGTIHQSVVTTADDLDAVDQWYRRALLIQPAEGTGVSSVTKIKDRDTPKERGYEVRRSLYVDNQVPKDGDPKKKVTRTPTVRTYIVKEADYTLVIVATRSRGDKTTQISVTYIPESSD